MVTNYAAVPAPVETALRGGKLFGGGCGRAYVFCMNPQIRNLAAGLTAVFCLIAASPVAAWSTDYDAALSFTKNNSSTLPEASNLLWITNSSGERNTNSFFTWTTNFDGQWRIKMVTWTRLIYSNSYAPGGKQTNFYGQGFLTVAGQITNFFATNYGTNITPEQAHLRVAQLLGMPDTSANDAFAEIWVRPEDIFRPARITSIAETNITSSWPGYAQANPDPLTYSNAVDGTSFAAYSNYFNDVLLNPTNSGIATNPYAYNFPFSGMGYTWDWASPTNDTNFGFIGMSEFVAPKSVSYYTDTFTPTWEYVTGIPEPGTSALLLVGLTAAWIIYRRRK